MARNTRSIYTVMPLAPDGGPSQTVLPFNAVITPYNPQDPGNPLPPDPGVPPDQPGTGGPRWYFTAEGWYFGFGPYARPRPVPIDGGHWVSVEGGWFYALAGPQEKPGPGDPPPVDPGEPPVMGPPRITWEHEEDGWYFVWGPFAKVRPLPPDWQVGGGKWEMREDGWYYVQGPYDKPKPIGPIDPPPTEPPTEPDADYKWVYTQEGWLFVIGPFEGGKPNPALGKK